MAIVERAAKIKRGLKATAFASIDAKARELAQEIPQAVKAASRQGAATGRGGATINSWLEESKKRLRLLADHISNRRKWVTENATFPFLVNDKEWRTRAEAAMGTVKTACLASLDEVMRVLALSTAAPAVRKVCERNFDIAYAGILEKLQLDLAASNEEARGATKKAGWQLAAKYAWPVITLALGIAGTYYWPKLAALVKLLRSP